MKSKLVYEEKVPPANVGEVNDEEPVKETPPIVRKKSKKNVATKGKKPVFEKETLSEVADKVEKEEEEVEKNTQRKRKSNN